MRDPVSRPMPLDQADGLRRLFAHGGTRFVPLVSNPHMAFGGVMIERLCAALAEHGRHTLVVDAGERAGAATDLALVDLPACVEQLSASVSYLAARGLPLRHVDARGHAGGFLHAVADAAPQADVVLVHAGAAELGRMFARSDEAVRPLLLADDRPASVTHAYGAMKLLVQRAGMAVFDLLLGAAEHSPRSERIAMQLATCADDFLGAVLRDWAQVDPASEVSEPPSTALRRMVRERLQGPVAAAAAAPMLRTHSAVAAGAAVH
jgi:hypothetical protein